MLKFGTKLGSRKRAILFESNTYFEIKIQYAELHCHRIADIYRLSADKNVSVEDLNIQRAKLANLNRISFLKQ